MTEATRRWGSEAVGYEGGWCVPLPVATPGAPAGWVGLLDGCQSDLNFRVLLPLGGVGHAVNATTAGLCVCVCVCVCVATPQGVG